jgi:hypothetical protein
VLSIQLIGDWFSDTAAVHIANSKGRLADATASSHKRVSEHGMRQWRVDMTLIVTAAAAADRYCAGARAIRLV